MPVLAIGALELVVFVAALMALLVLIAGNQILKLFHGVVSHAPWPVDWLAGGLEHYAQAAMEAMAAGLEDVVGGVAHWLWGLTVGLWHLVYQMVQTLADAKTWAVNAYQHATAALGAAEAFTVHQVNVLRAALNADVAALQRTMAQDLSRAEAYAGAAAAGALATAQGLISDVQSEANRLFGQAEAAATAEVKAAEALATAQADAVQSEAVRLFGQAEAGIRTLEGDVAAIPGEITGAIDGSVPGMIDKALAAAGVGALAGLISQVGALAVEADTCLEPLCDTVTPNAKQLGNLGKFLKGLEGLAVEGIFLALAAEMLTHPDAVIEDMSSVIGAVGDPIMAGFRDLTGG
jgi:hypothetical protein